MLGKKTSGIFFVTLALAAFFAVGLIGLYSEPSREVVVPRLQSSDDSNGPSDVQRRGVSAMESAAQDVTARDSSPGSNVDPWRQRFYASEDRFAFAVQAAEAAIAGDSRAQYFLSRVLKECGSRVTPIARSGLPVDNYLIEFFAPLPHMPEGRKRELRQEIERCERFIHRNPLARFSLSADEQTHEYWFRRAVEAGDPLAVMERTVRNAPQAAESSESHEEALAGIRVAVESKEPGAIAAIGSLFMYPGIAEDQSLQGPAWLLAACEFGYDCSADNPEMKYLSCAQESACPTLQDIFQRDMEGAQFGEVYAASQDIVYKIRQEDWSGLEPYLQMKE